MGQHPTAQALSLKAETELIISAPHPLTSIPKLKSRLSLKRKNDSSSDLGAGAGTDSSSDLGAGAGTDSSSDLSAGAGTDSNSDLSAGAGTDSNSDLRRLDVLTMARALFKAQAEYAATGKLSLRVRLNDV